MMALIKFFSVTAFISVSLWIVPACTKNAEVKDNDAKAKQALVGVWRGEGNYAGEEDVGWSETWKMVRQADGQYSVEYLILNQDEKLYEHSSDNGTWSYENGVYYEVNQNGEKITYVVYSVKDDWFEYNIDENDDSTHIQEIKTVDTYELQKPPEGYELVRYDEPIDEQIKDVINEVDEAVVNEIEQAIQN